MNRLDFEVNDQKSRSRQDQILSNKHFGRDIFPTQTACGNFIKFTSRVHCTQRWTE